MTDQPEAIDPSHYDGRIHAVPFTPGADFIAKLEAYKADGFTYQLTAPDFFRVCKIMPGAPIPSEAA